MIHLYPVALLSLLASEVAILLAGDTHPVATHAALTVSLVAVLVTGIFATHTQRDEDQ